jgi:hypothetical protein
MVCLPERELILALVNVIKKSLLLRFGPLLEVMTNPISLIFASTSISSLKYDELEPHSFQIVVGFYVRIFDT